MKKNKKSQRRRTRLYQSPRKMVQQNWKIVLYFRSTSVGERVYKYLYRVDGFVYKWQLLRAVRARIGKMAEKN